MQESLEMAVVLLAKSNLTDTDRTRLGQGRMEVKIVDEGQRRHSRQNFLSTIVQIRIILPDPDPTKRKINGRQKENQSICLIFMLGFLKRCISVYFLNVTKRICFTSIS